MKMTRAILFGGLVGSVLHTSGWHVATWQYWVGLLVAMIWLAWERLSDDE